MHTTLGNSVATSCGICECFIRLGCAMRRKCLHYDCAGRTPKCVPTLVVVVVARLLAGSAYERGNLLISPLPRCVWVMVEFISTDSLFTQAPSLPAPAATPRRCHTFSHVATHTSSLSHSRHSPSLSSRTHKLPHGAVWYEKLTVIYAIMLTKYLLGRSSWLA